jgi:multiple sugar transport system substrate-binding protein
MNKKVFIRTGWLVLMAMLPVITSVAAQAAEFNWRKYEGATIRVLLSKSAFTPMNQEFIKEFEKKTGIKVIEESYGSAPLRQKLTMELGAKNKDLDVFQGMGKTDLEYYRAGWVSPLDDFLKNPALTAPDYDYADIFPKVRAIIDGKTVGITMSMNPVVLMYRKDLFEKYKIKVPTNWKELEEAAKKLTLDTDGDGKTDIYGWIARMNEENTAIFACFLFSNGAEWLDKNNKPVFNSPKAVEALKYYGQLLKNYGPPGGNTIGWQQVIGALAQGKAAMTTEISIFADMVLEDPKQSKVAGKIGYTYLPAARPEYATTLLPTNDYHISAFSQKKEAAWLFLQFMSDKAHLLAYQLKMMPTSRKSAWMDPKFKAADKLPELTRIQFEGIQKGIVHYELHITAFDEARPYLSRMIYSAYEGGDVQKTANDTVKTIEEIMKKSK